MLPLQYKNRRKDGGSMVLSSLYSVPYRAVGYILLGTEWSDTGRQADPQKKEQNIIEISVDQPTARRRSEPARRHN